MARGALLLPPGYHPLIDGAVVPSGKLAFYQTSTTTPQSTYTDANLSVSNSNPVQLNANGGLDTLVYGDPSLSRYRLRIYSSADVLLDTHDDLLVWGADTANYSEGSFTGTITGCTTSPTGTVNYRIFANSSGTGKFVILYIDSAITGTSNTTALTLTGLPAAVTPVTTRYSHGTIATDNGASVQAFAHVTSGGAVVFYTDDPLSTTGWTNSGTKGVPISTIMYPL